MLQKLPDIYFSFFCGPDAADLGDLMWKTVCSAQAKLPRECFHTARCFMGSTFNEQLALRICAPVFVNSFLEGHIQIL